MKNGNAELGSMPIKCMCNLPIFFKNKFIKRAYKINEKEEKDYCFVEDPVKKNE